MLRIIGCEKSCVLVNISWWIPNLKGRDTKFSIKKISIQIKKFQFSKKNFNSVETLDETIVKEKFDHFFNKFKCAAKVNLGFGFNLKNLEDGGFRYFYAHENNTLLDQSKLVCTHVDLAKLKDFFNKTDVIESCSRERMDTKWRFYKLTNLTVFAVLLKGVLMGCENAFLPKTSIEKWYNQLCHV